MKVNPLAPWTDDDIAVVQARPRAARAPARVAGLPVDRLLAVHPSGARRRRPACRPLGRARQGRVRPPRLARALNHTTSKAEPNPMRQIASHLSALEAESIHLLREVAAEFERPVLLFSGGKDSVVMAHVAAKAFWPAQAAVPGHARRHRAQLPRGHRRSATPRSSGSACASSSRRCRTRSTRGRVVEDTGPGASRNRLADHHAARRDRGARVRRGDGRRPPRRGEGARQGALLLVPRRVRPVGPEEPAARAVEPLQRPAPQGRAHPRVPAVELDRARHLAVHRGRGDRAAVDLLRAPPRRCSAATAC